MAVSKLNTVHRIMMFARCLVTLPLVAQNIYKTVDENGRRGAA